MADTKNYDNIPKYIYKFIMLYQIPQTESWLKDMASQGYILTNIEGNRFYFKKDVPLDRHYFLLNPCVGNNSEGWVYYEFLQKGGERIISRNSILGGVQLALQYNGKLFSDNYKLICYYYSYRNYRILRRFSMNLLVCLLIALLCVFLCFLQPINMWFALQYGGGALLWGAFQAFSLFRFRESCKRTGFLCTWRRPHRPGF